VSGRGARAGRLWIEFELEHGSGLDAGNHHADGIGADEGGG
jgi:hypothetical protein